MANVPVEYVTKTIYNISYNFKLKHQIKFGSKNSKDERLEPLYVSSYLSKQYSPEMDLMSINIDTSDYLILEYKYRSDISGNKQSVSIYLSYPHLFGFKSLLRNALKWFYNTEYEKMFFIKNEEIKFNAKFKDERLETNITIDKKYVCIRPAIIEVDDHYDQGVIMNLNEEALVELTVEELEALYDAINGFNLYESSLILTSYVLSSHPEMLLSTKVKESNSVKPNSDFFTRRRKKSHKNET